MSGLRGKGVATLARGAVQVVARDLAEPAGDASPAAERRARRGRLRIGAGRRRRVADAPAAGDPRAERRGRHDQSHAGASRAPRARSISRELPAGCACRACRQSRAARDRCARRAGGTLRRQRSGPLRLLVFGGSQGAARLNAVVPAALATIDARRGRSVIHQAGERHHRAGAASCTRSTACRPTCAPSSTTWRKRMRGRTSSCAAPVRSPCPSSPRRDCRRSSCRSRPRSTITRRSTRSSSSMRRPACRSPKRELTPPRLAEELQKLLSGGRAQARRDGGARALGRDHRCGRAARRCMRRGRGRCAHDRSHAPHQPHPLRRHRRQRHGRHRRSAAEPRLPGAGQRPEAERRDAAARAARRARS